MGLDRLLCCSTHRGWPGVPDTHPDNGPVGWGEGTASVPAAAMETHVVGRGTQLACDPFRAVDGVVLVPDGPGLGIEIDRDVLARYTVHL